AFVTSKRIVAAAAIEKIVSAAANQDIDTAASAKDIGAIASFQRVVTIRAFGDIVEQVSAAKSQQNVVAGSAEQAVVTIATGKTVVVATTMQNGGTSAGVQVVVAGISPEFDRNGHVRIDRDLVVAGSTMRFDSRDIGILLPDAEGRDQNAARCRT